MRVSCACPIPAHLLTAGCDGVGAPVLRRACKASRNPRRVERVREEGDAKQNKGENAEPQKFTHVTTISWVRLALTLGFLGSALYLLVPSRFDANDASDHSDSEESFSDVTRLS